MRVTVNFTPAAALVKVFRDGEGRDRIWPSEAVPAENPRIVSSVDVRTQRSLDARDAVRDAMELLDEAKRQLLSHLPLME